ncbi:MAG: hypothetical protein IJX13_08555 [Clostridia bacterium]|nr:hypothetical protein [Clostridia bacterium]
MKKKKIIIATIFLILIALTAIHTVVFAVKSYQYDMDPANGVDILEGFGAALTMIIGGLVIFYELDLFYTVYYFFIKPKTIAKSILNILSNVSLLLVFFSESIADILSKSVFDIFKEDGIVTIAIFLIYLLLRCIYLMVSIFPLDEED